MSAVADCWAHDQTRALTVVRARLAAPKGDEWAERVIQCFYALVNTTYANSGADIARLARDIDGFKELGDSGAAAVWRIWRFTKDWAFVHSKLSTHATWTANAFVPTVFFQAWMWHEPSKQADFLTALGAMTCRAAQPYVVVDRVRHWWTQLVPTAAASTPNAGRLRLALLDIVAKKKQAHPASKAFLSSLVTNGAFTVGVDGPLDGLSNADAVLQILGIQQQASNTDANVDMDQEGHNESRVQSMSRHGVVTASRLYVRARPTTHGRPLDRLLARGERVYIMGQTGHWYLLDLDGQRGYSYKRYIRLD